MLHQIISMFNGLLFSRFEGYHTDNSPYTNKKIEKNVLELFYSAEYV